MLTRRSFSKIAVAAPLAYTALNGCAEQTAGGSGYRALVCVYLFGGMDNYDTILPFDTPSYNRYAEIRSDLLSAYAAQSDGSSRAQGALLPLEPSNGADFGSRNFALPPQMKALHALFQTGAAAVIGNVGPLIEPVDAAGFRYGAANIPKRLFSHSDQESTWMSLAPVGAQFGWGGLFGDAALASRANRNPVFTAISLGGNSVFLSGQEVQPFQISDRGAHRIGVEHVIRTPARVSGTLDDHLRAVGADRANLLERDYVNKSRVILDANTAFSAALGRGATLETPFPESDIGGQMRAVANAIAVRRDVGASRQVFFVSAGDFDTHSNQASALPRMQQDVSDAMAAFYDATQEMGVETDVTAFTASEFGRTLATNGDGTDHGWGGHHFVVGGAVKGGKIYGDIPICDFGHANDVGKGSLIPTTSVEQYAATLGSWFGLSSSELTAMLPALGNFPNRTLDFI